MRVLCTTLSETVVEGTSAYRIDSVVLRVQPINEPAFSRNFTFKPHFFFDRDSDRICLTQ